MESQILGLEDHHLDMINGGVQPGIDTYKMMASLQQSALDARASARPARAAENFSSVAQQMALAQINAAAAKNLVSGPVTSMSGSFGAGRLPGSGSQNPFGAPPSGPQSKAR